MKKFNNKVTIGLVLIIALCALVFNYTKAIEISPEELQSVIKGQEVSLGGSVCYPYQGCTGTSTVPTLGQVLLGQADGSYNLVATSTLGIGVGTFDVLGQATSTKDWLLAQDNTWTGAGNTSFTGNIGIATTTPAYKLDVYGTLRADGNLILGSASPEAGFIGNGDLFTNGSLKSKEGVYTEARKYGAGLEVLKNGNANTYTNVINGDATLTASTQILTDTHASFDSSYEGQFLVVFSSTPSYEGAVGEIQEVLDSTHIILSFGTSNGDTIVDANAMSYAIYEAPIFFVGDNGDFELTVGNSEDAVFEIEIPEGNGFTGVYIDDIAGADQHQALTIDVDSQGYDGIVALNLFMQNASSTNPSDGVLEIMASLEGNANNYLNSSLRFLDFNLIGTGTDNDVDIMHINNFPLASHIIHSGNPNDLERAYYDDGDGTTIDSTTAFNSTGTNVTLFENDNSIVYVASATSTEFTNIAFDISTESQRNINAEYYYCTGDDTWVALPGVTDTTNGFKQSGSINFMNPVDRGQCNEEIDSTAFADTDARSYIAIKRTRSNNWTGQKPIENLVSISGGGSYLYMDSYGLKPVPSAGAPYACTASTFGMKYADSVAVALLWCNGSTWVEYAETADITVHNNLSGLQGGTDAQYYHLTSDEYTGTGTGNFVRLDSPSFTGNIGIGTASPAYELDIDGFTNTKSIHEVSEEGLVLGMNFNTETLTGSAGSETVLDSSTYNNHGTNSGATATSTGGFNGGGAFSFDGSDDYIETSLTDNSPFNTTGFTLSAWINADGLGETSGVIISKSAGTGGGAGFQFRLGTGGDNLAFRIDEGNIPLSASNSISYGTLYHTIVVVNASAEVSFYINGELSGDANQSSGKSLSDIDGIREVTIGNLHSTATSRTFDGKIDNLQIYNRALSADEIKALYLQRAEVGDSFVSQSDVFVDSSGNVGIGTSTPSEILSVAGNVLADSYIEYSPRYAGDALSVIKDIKCESNTINGDWCKIDHNTLPDGVRYENEYEVSKKVGEETIEHKAVYEDKLIEVIEEDYSEKLGATEMVLVKEAYTEVVPIMATSTETFVGRDLGKSVQFNLKAIQELLELNEALTLRVEKLEKQLNTDAKLGVSNETFNQEDMSILRKIINFFKSLL